MSAEQQYGFQSNVSVQQEIMPVEDLVRHGMIHIAILDLQKVYDRVDRRDLLEGPSKWIKPELLNIVDAYAGHYG